MPRPKTGVVNPRTNAKIAEQPYAPIPSLPGAFGKKDKKKGKKTGGMSVR